MFCSLGTISEHQSNVRISDFEQFLPLPREIYLFKDNSNDTKISKQNKQNKSKNKNKTKTQLTVLLFDLPTVWLDKVVSSF